MKLFKNYTHIKHHHALEQLDICSPTHGSVLPLSQVNDPVFAEEMMGPGIAVVPTVGQIVAPFDGTVVSVFRTLHAVTLKADNEAEVLIHVGLNTVTLDGRFFKSHTSDGAKVKKGDLLLTFDMEEIQKMGFEIVTPMIVINAERYELTKKEDESFVDEGDVLITLENK